MKRSRESGFALLAALWLVAALTVLAGSGIAVAKTGRAITRNRVQLARAAWAREACLAILLDRFARDPTTRTVPTVDLGRGTWCRVALEDPSAKLNVNLATRAALAALLPADSLAAAIVILRQGSLIADLRQLLSLPGFDSSLVHVLGEVLTTRGTGTVNVATANDAVLRLLPGMTDEAVWTIAYRRSGGQPVKSLDELAGYLSRPARDALLASYAELTQIAAFAPTQLVATVEGGVTGTPIVARAVLTAVPIQRRLAVIRREVE